MDTRTFLEKVLPQGGGTYFGASVGPNDKYTQSKLESLDALAAYVDSRRKQRHNVYFATGVYDGDKREARSTALKKALYLDIDTGKGKDYDTKKQAAKAFEEFRVATGFVRPSIIVDSGNGLHYYWVLRKPISLDQWVILADTLKSLCKSYGLHSDNKVTTDAARILRVPGTVNYKDPANPKEAKILRAYPEEYTLRQLQDALGTGTTSAVEMLRGTVGDDLTSGFEHTKEPRYAAHMVKDCEIFKESIQTGGEGQQEPLWMYQLQLLAFCEDGDEYIHAISDEHATYDYRRTEKKFEQQQNKAKHETIGPIRCETLSMYHSEACERCPFNGQITTPLQLGRAASDMPYGWKQDDKAIYKADTQLDPASGEYKTSWVKVLSFTIKDVEIFQRASGDEVRTFINFTQNFGGSTKHVRFAYEDAFFSKPHVFLAAKLGSPLQPHEGLIFRELIVEFHKQMERARSVKISPKSLGWNNIAGETAFVLPSGAYTKNGISARVAFKDSALREIYTPKGERDIWLKVSHALTAQNRHANNAAILSGFASPLIQFSDVSSALLSIYSPESGTGKSTALKAAQAIWGDPVDGVNSLQDTYNSVVHKLGFTNSLPAYWDELRVVAPEQFLNMIFQLTQGKERSRLSADLKQREVGTWRTMLTIAANTSLLDHAEMVDGSGTNASKLRIFEVEAVSITDEDKIADLPPTILHTNYGHIGMEYAQYLAKNADRVQDLMTKTYALIAKKVDAKPDERFWMATASSLLAAGKIANDLGFTKVNLSSFASWLVGEYIRMRDSTRQITFNTSTSTDWVEMYLSAHTGQLVITDKLSSKGQPFGNIHHAPSHGQIIGVEGDGRIRLMKAPFRRWIYENNGNPTKIFDNLKKNYGAVESKAVCTGGVPGTTAARVWCLEFDKPSED